MTTAEASNQIIRDLVWIAGAILAGFLLLAYCDSANKPESEASRVKRLCSDLHYMAERKPLSEVTARDLKQLQACKQLGY